MNTPPISRANTADIIRSKINTLGSAVHRQLKVHSDSFEDFLAFGESKLDISRVAKVALLFKQTEDIKREERPLSLSHRLNEEYVNPILMSELYGNMLLLLGVYSSVQYVFQIYAQDQANDREVCKIVF